MFYEPQELRTFVTALLPSQCSVRLTAVTMEQASMRLQLAAMAPTACCPGCTVPSSSVHSRYQRHLTDLPWGACAVRLQLMVRKFVCRTPTGSVAIVLCGHGGLSARALHPRRDGAAAQASKSDADILIAATALKHNLVMVPENVNHFRRIPGLSIESWRV